MGPCPSHRRSCPNHELDLSRGARRQTSYSAPRPDRSRCGHRRDKERWQPHAACPDTTRRRRDRLHGVRGQIRRPGRPCPSQQAHTRRLRWHHRVAHKPWRHRHGPVRTPADANTRRHRRRWLNRPASGVASCRLSHRGRPGHLQGRHRDQHLRPSHHPGRRVRRIPAGHSQPVDRRTRLLQPDLRVRRRSVPGHQLQPRSHHE